MPRMARVVIPGCPHHVTQRGNRGEDVFFGEADRLRYLVLLGEYCQKHGLAIQAYCLMSNHVHLVAVPREEASLGAAMKPLHMRYAQYVNWSRQTAGRLWQGRFFSCPLDDEHLWAAVRYVERNPVRAELVSHAEDYRWSSAAAHCGTCDNAIVTDPCGMTTQMTPQQWSQWLRESWEDQEQMSSRLRRCTRTGRPAGKADFVTRIETLVGRVLRANNVGRPRNPQPTTDKPPKDPPNTPK